MLAMLPSSVSHHDRRHVPVLSTSTLTFSTTTSSSSLSAGPGQMRTSRPTLTINTAINSSKARSFGKGSSLSLHALSAVSPTTKNTFVNTYQTTSTSSPLVAHRAVPSTPITTTRHVQPQTENISTTLTTRTTTTPTTSTYVATTLISTEQQSSIQQAASAGKSSILITSVTYRSDQVMSDKSLRPSWPAKRVSFRDPLDEEIKTLKYVLAHSDLESSISGSKLQSSDTPYPRSKTESSSSQSSECEQAYPLYSAKPSSNVNKIDASNSDDLTNTTTSTSIRSPQRRNSSPKPSSRLKRDSSSDDDSDDAVPQTPIAGRCKRRREWTWTLDPLPDQKTAAAAKDGSVASNDDDSVSTSSRYSESSTN